jgi:hypothetical protein
LANEDVYENKGEHFPAQPDFSSLFQGKRSQAAAHSLHRPLFRLICLEANNGAIQM